MHHSYSEKNCLECGEPVTTGRSDRRFCCTQHKNAYHNRKYKQLKNLVTDKVDKVLHHNRKVLAEAYSVLESHGPYVLKKLVEKGFKPRYYIGIVKTKDSNNYHVLYDYGFRFINNNQIEIIYKEGGIHND